MSLGETPHYYEVLVISSSESTPDSSFVRKEKKKKTMKVLLKTYTPAVKRTAQKRTAQNIQTFFKVKREKTKERHQLHPTYLRSKDCVSLTTIQKILKAKTMVLLMVMMKVIWRSMTSHPDYMELLPPHQDVFNKFEEWLQGPDGGRKD